MSFDIWGFGGPFLLRLPTQPFGYVLLFVYLISISYFFLYFLKRRRHSHPIPRKTSRNFLLILLLSAPPATALFNIQFPLAGSPSQGLYTSSFQPTIAVLGAIPWMLAGGFMGGWQGMLIALLGGFFRGAWSTNELLTPFHITLQAGFILWLIERNYDDPIGNALRQPIISSILGGLFLGFLHTAEIFAYGEWDLYDGLSFALSNAKVVILAEVAELAVAGLIAEFLRFSFPKLWYRPRWLTPGPYRRSLTGKILSVFLLLGFLASTILLYGDWLLVRSSARELVESQMTQTALEAGSGIPYFIQTGRSLIRRLSDEVIPLEQDPSQLQTQLDRGLTLVPFFDGLVLFDENGEEITHTLSEEWDQEAFSLILEDAIEDALSGIPGERILPPEQDSLAARLIFFSPIDSAESEVFNGVLAGWTNLETNPFLLPTIHRLGEMSSGSAFIIDGVARIIIHSDPARIMQQANLDITEQDQVRQIVSSKGLQELVYIYPVEGYSWYVVLEKPISVVDRLALSLGFQLFSMITILGFVVIIIVYIVSKKLTQPLEQMAGAAESIARGNLNQTAPKSGEDEIGVLAGSFERMRASLQDRLNEMDLLLAVSQRIASSLSFNDFLPPILKGMRDLTDADIVRLIIVPDQNHDSNLDVYQAGQDPGNWASLDQQIVILSRERGQFILENPSRAQAVLNVHGLRETIDALMALPIHHEDQFVGTIWFGHRQPHVFSANEINIGSIIAGQLGVAINNAYLYQQAEAERLRLKAVLDATPDAVIVTDQDGLISLANPAAEIVLNIRPEKARGMSVEEVVRVPEILEWLLAANAESKTSEVDLGDGRIFFASVTPIQGVDLQMTGKACVLWDITHYKKLDTLKSEFVSTVSHDLRMPLTLMRGYVKMLSMVGTTNNQQKEYIQKITRSADQMARLVDNVLDLGRIEAGLGLKREEVEIKEIIGDVVKTYRPQAVTKQIALMADQVQDIPEVFVDSTLLRQAITNLVDNAIRFTPSGGRISISAIQEEGALLVRVEDTGAGISPTDQARLFEKFTQIRNRGGLEEVGSGLGLAIVKSIVEQHGGRVKVESKLGTGSIFTIEIPLMDPHPKNDLDNEVK
jgi:two-component system phosphate regulon sensor histidine kinase PhoR